MTKYIYGKNSVLDALKANYPIKKIYLLKGHDIKLNFKNVEYLTNFELNKLINGNHQGYIAEIEEYKYYDLGSIFKDRAQFVLMLDHIQDPQNLGAIIRSANAFSVKYIIIPKDRSASITPTVLKISSGGFNNIKIIKVASLFDAINQLKKNGFWVYATSLNAKAINVNNASFNFPLCLIMGNEEKGVSNTLLNISDQNAYIPQSGDVQSLNVSVATGIMLYEINKKLGENNE